jgi:stage II sporulation protein P
MYAPLADFQTRELTEQSESSPGRLLFRIVSLICPMGSYTLNQSETSVFLEDPDTQSVILALQEQDENAVDEDGNVTITDTVTEEQKDKTADEDQSESSAQVSLEKLKDFDYLKSHYYTVDSTTSISATELDAETFLNKDMTINIEGTEPKVLIYHTHSQEAFQDSKSGEVSDTIVGVGDYLTSLLEDKYGIPVLHHTGVYDLVDGKLDRSQAYELAKPELTKLLEENPEIEVVIDLHRDGVAQGTRLVTEVNGKQTAKIMFFNGLSRTNSNGNIGYLSNPYIEDNLAFSFQMELKAEALYPDFTRKIYLKSYRYNMHFKPKTLLIEAGAQTNTVEEEMNAMEPLAEILAAVLTP